MSRPSANLSWNRHVRHSIPPPTFLRQPRPVHRPRSPRPAPGWMTAVRRRPARRKRHQRGWHRPGGLRPRSRPAWRALAPRSDELPRPDRTHRADRRTEFLGTPTVPSPQPWRRPTGQCRAPSHRVHPFCGSIRARRTTTGAGSKRVRPGAKSSVASDAMRPGRSSTWSNSYSQHPAHGGCDRWGPRWLAPTGVLRRRGSRRHADGRRATGVRAWSRPAGSWKASIPRDEGALSEGDSGSHLRVLRLQGTIVRTSLLAWGLG